MTNSVTRAATAAEIDVSVDGALASLYNTVKDGKRLISNAKAVLVFPTVYKAGVFFLGGEYGEGSLRTRGRTVDYYSTASGAFGWQLGAQKKSIIILFMQDDVLKNFLVSPNWKIGVDASVTVLTVGADGSIDSEKLNQPIIAFVIDQKGLMYNLTLEGTKVTKIKK
jgi:lipid-binding SYLF domain-containing protein